MFKVSRDNPAYWLTSVAHNRLPIFQRDEFKKIVTDAFNEARRKHEFLIFGYVIMPDHTHAVTDNAHEMKDILRSEWRFREQDHQAPENERPRGVDTGSEPPVVTGGLAKPTVDNKTSQPHAVASGSPPLTSGGSMCPHHPNAMRITDHKQIEWR